MKRDNRFTTGLMMSAALFAAGVLYTACEQPTDDEKNGGNGKPAIPGENGGETSDPNSIEVNEAGGLVASLDWIKANGIEGNNYIVTVTEDADVTPQTLSVMDSPKLNKAAITLQSENGAAKRLQLSTRGAMFKVIGNIKLVLQDITLEGLSTQSTEGCTTDTIDNTSALVVMKEGSSLEMKNGSQITGNRSTSSYGGGVHVDDSTFTMSGGSISGNTTYGVGGGVYVDDGTFTMSGGSISGNTARDSGGGVSVEKSSAFEMSGGSISGNTAKYGGGVVMYDGTFTMSGNAVISGNTASNSGGGVDMCDGTFEMSGGSISENTARDSGGGVNVFGTFEMSGGSISGNTANEYDGGGVAFYDDGDGGFINKTGGTIYGSDGGDLKNTAGTNGHVAVYVSRYRNTTAGPDVNLSTDLTNWGQ